MNVNEDRAAIGAECRSSRRVVIIGGGFGGLACAIELGAAGDIKVTLVDRRNHNLFQPLLYQIATAALSPAEIAEPIRKTLARFKNFNKITEVSAPSSRSVSLSDGDSLSYNKLVLATGSD
ncbi:FAD-dependent oxidoreductase [Rhizobium leguminosarum]|uniref:FAD-dependent oxidoreductase n=1 Tax=Rhizobium leguminosarum TaxID=384 RepID=UPI0021B13AD9|nr:FAD-dependent oxidoreductase [Rhizobium leguminosarum]